MRVQRGSTNIFADLGYADAIARQTKTRLVLRFNELYRSGKGGGIDEDTLKQLADYKLDGFSVEQLEAYVRLVDN